MMDNSVGKGGGEGLVRIEGQGEGARLRELGIFGYCSSVSIYILEGKQAVPMFVAERRVGGEEILDSLPGSRSRVVEEVLWSNTEWGVVFVNTRGSVVGILVGCREGKE